MNLYSVLPYLSLFLLLCSFSIQSAYTPRYPPKAQNAYFQETFEDPSRWVVTEDPEYKGVWEFRRPLEPFDEVSMPNLMLMNASQRHGISTVFPEVLDITDKKLIVQYEVKVNGKWECGGAYIKLFSHNESSPFDPKTLNGSTPYTIMFGPDKCGTHNPVIHFIFRHRNPINGVIEEKHLTPKPKGEAGDLTHLYTLIVDTDNTFRILVDREEVASGSLLKDFEPPVNPPKEIDDPTDKKPEDWVDEPEILDPNAKKPEDWVDEATIPDPEAVKPADWDDEEDGDWEPPQIPNPAYKGPWIHPKIPNPAYKGEWKPRQIPNPNYFEDLHPHNFLKMSGVGFELWTIDGLINFGNILITSDEEEANQWAEVWEEKSIMEQKIDASRNSKSSFQEYLDLVKDFASENPIVVGISGGLVIILVLLSLLTRGKSKKPTDEKKKEDEVKDEEKETEKEEKVEEESTETEVSTGKQVTSKRRGKPKKE